MDADAIFVLPQTRTELPECQPLSPCGRRGDRYARLLGRPYRNNGPATVLTPFIIRTGLRGESLAGAIDMTMKTFHEWLAERTTKNEGLWLNQVTPFVPSTLSATFLRPSH